MLNKTDLTKVYDTVLSIPGMNEAVKIELRIPRKNVLLLSKVIERGLAQNGEESSAGVLDVVSAETLQEVNAIAGDLLQKAGLTDMNEKLKSFYTILISSYIIHLHFLLFKSWITGLRSRKKQAMDASFHPGSFIQRRISNLDRLGCRNSLCSRAGR